MLVSVAAPSSMAAARVFQFGLQECGKRSDRQKEPE